MADPLHAHPAAPEPPADITCSGGWTWSRLGDRDIRAGFEAAVLRRIATRRWFGAKSHTLSQVSLLDQYQLDNDGSGDGVCIALVEVQYADRDRETYQLPLAIAAADAFARIAADQPGQDWARVRFTPGGDEHVIYDALAQRGGCDALLGAFRSTGTSSAGGATIALEQGPQHDVIAATAGEDLEPRLSAAEQSNSSVRFGERLILKLYRRIEPGIHPDWEVNAHLAAQHYGHIPPLVGAIEYRLPGEPPRSLAILQGFVPNFGDGWSYVLEQLCQILDGAKDSFESSNFEWPEVDAFTAAQRGVPLAIEQQFGHSLADARQLGDRTAGMHLALAEATLDAEFQPQPISAAARARAYTRASQLLAETYELLARHRPQLSPETGAAADVLLRSRSQLEFMQREAAEVPIHALAIRIHGDFHLGQVLMTEHGPVMIDFEGEPSRPLAERRERQLALRDVAGMIRSFHYASCAAAAKSRETHGPDAANMIDAWSRAWYYWATASFLAAYLARARGAVFLPERQHELRALLNACILDKAVYELRYELNSRPDWVHLPLGALVDVVAGSGLIY